MNDENGQCCALDRCKVAEIPCRPFFSSQSFQHGTPPLFPRKLQTQTCRCSGRVAPTLLGIMAALLSLQSLVRIGLATAPFMTLQNNTFAGLASHFVTACTEGHASVAADQSALWRNTPTLHRRHNVQPRTAGFHSVPGEHRRSCSNLRYRFGNGRVTTLTHP